VSKVVRIHDMVWVRTPYSLVHSYECFGGHSGSTFTGRLSDYTAP